MITTIHKDSLHLLTDLTVKVLRTKQSQLGQIRWQDGEANPDTGFSKLACQCCLIAWEDLRTRFPEYAKVELKAEPPDINLIFSFREDKHQEQHHIELKSCKKPVIPGSTIGTLDINQPLIFCLRPKTSSEEYQIRSAPYYLAMGESQYDKFQDRTPRPLINFNKMPDTTTAEAEYQFPLKSQTDWITRYADCALNRLREPGNCKASWQDDLIRIIQQKTLERFVNTTSVEEFKTLKQQG